MTLRIDYTHSDSSLKLILDWVINFGLFQFKSNLINLNFN
jgi:hypothetical protein